MKKRTPGNRAFPEDYINFGPHYFTPTFCFLGTARSETWANRPFAIMVANQAACLTYIDCVKITTRVRKSS
jgi:hypothetical protein